MTEASEAKRFFESLAGDFDTAAALQWSFLLDGLSEDQVQTIMEEVGRLGFTEVEPLADEEREGHYTLWFAEVRVHSAQSLAERVAAVEQFASREGLVMSDFSARSFLRLDGCSPRGSRSSPSSSDLRRSTC
jgi:hypothetical protein